MTRWFVRALFFGIVLVGSAVLTIGRACADHSGRSPRTSASRNKGAIVRRIPLRGEGSWDHVVASASDRRLYVSHASHLDVLDLDGDSLVGVMDSLPGVHGVALNPETHRGYSSNGGDSTITVFDTRWLRVLGRVHLKADAPDGIVFDPASSRVFAMHGDTPSLSVIDAGPDTLRSTLQLGGSPDGGVPDGHGRLYLALKDRSELLVIDTRRLIVESRWAVAPCQGPDAIALDTIARRVVLGCDNGIVVSVETGVGLVHGEFHIGPRVDGVSLLGNLVATSTADGVVAISECTADRCSNPRAVESVRGSRTSALDERTRRLFVPYDDRLSRHAAGGRGDAGFGVLVLQL